MGWTYTEAPVRPTHMIRNVRKMLVDLASEVRGDVHLAGEPRAQALLETTAGTLEGLAKAYADYEKGTEEAWRM